ncbi:hypothetical protein BJY01DRAFT_249957 [Aspergillus pseudoustus]|uniref:Cytochrome P450 n=1 Tax=Aspergillus pseudoustus TaxID=1810923 RepID=A0ABR4JNC9_9EURO
MFPTAEPQTLLVWLAACFVLLGTIRSIRDWRRNSGLVTVNKPRAWDVFGIQAKRWFLCDGEELMKRSLETGRIPGFEVFREATHPDHILDGYSKTQMTIHLGSLLDTISRTTASTLQRSLGTGNVTDCHEVPLQQAVSLAMTEITGRLFYGPEVARDAQVSDAIMCYTMVSLDTGTKLHLWPAVLQPVIYWLLPSC